MKQEYGAHETKTQTKGYLLSLFGFSLLFLGVNIAATQYLAMIFDYHEGLGKPLYENYYQPFAWVLWSFKYQMYYPEQFTTFFIIMFAAFAMTFLGYIFLRLITLRKPKKHDDVHGTAHWANEDEIKKAGILHNNKGVYIGGWLDKKGNTQYLRHNGAEHVLAFAPTRSGKGIGLVIPTLLSWPHSAIILDIKGENWALTSGWRQKHANNKVLKFDPTAISGGVRFNPLDEIRIGTEYEVADVQNLTYMIVDHNGHGMNDFWQKAAFSFLTGVFLHAIYKAKNEGEPTPSLQKIYQTINDPQRDINEVLADMASYPHKGDEPHPKVATTAREMLNKAPGELSGVIGTVSGLLSLYDDPLIAKNICFSDFKIRDLMNGDQPVSLYLIIKPSDKDRLKPLVRLIMNQILRTLIEEIKFEGGESVKTYKHRLLLMLDEFASLGKLEVFQESLAYMAGYGIMAYIIIQDLTQLYNAYTKDENIISNCHVRIAYAPNKVETAEILSKMTGTTTVVKSFTTTSGGRISVMLNHVSESFQEVSRPLLTPDECMRLPGAVKDGSEKIKEAGDMLIFIAGKSPIYGKQILYFKDPVFVDRSKVPEPNKTDVIIKAREDDKTEPSYAFKL
ncbi:MAG: type IV secretory system conjugative DNA transfer family protein [Bacilli bacterium]|nr:type IV secretory system conjugative DNA transfer family protein [Bacilli bacterium]